jgi:hypothetical protein
MAMKTEPTQAGEQGVIDDLVVKRKVPKGAKPGGGSLEGTPLGDMAGKAPEQGELILTVGRQVP